MELKTEKVMTEQEFRVGRPFGNYTDYLNREGLLITLRNVNRKLDYLVEKAEACCVEQGKTGTSGRK